MSKQKSKIEVDKIYVFVKSGNKVRTIRKCGDKEYKGFWEVKRVDTGKGLFVKETSLVDVEEFSN